VIDYGGNVSPHWKLTRFSVNPGGTVFGADRKKTSVVIITIGPLAKKQKPCRSSGPGRAGAAAARGRRVRHCDRILNH